MSFCQKNTLALQLLILHGDDGQIVPIADSALLSAKLVKNALLKVYKGAAHGMCSTEKDIINADILSFIKTGKVEKATHMKSAA